MENVDRKIFDELFYFKQEVEKELKELRGTMGELIQVINSLKENSNKEILMMRVAYKNGIQVSGRYN